MQISFFIKIHYYLRCTSWLHKRLSMTACGCCFIFVEYCCNKEILYKIQRGECIEQLQSVPKLCSLIWLCCHMGGFGMRWRILVCWHFNTKGTVIDMVWLSPGEEIPWIKTQDKRTISFLNWKIYSDRPVFTLEKQIRSIFSSNESDWSKRTASHLSTISRLF